MVDFSNEFIEEVSRYTLTAKDLNGILDSLKNEISKNNKLIINANKEDVKYNKKQIKIDEFLHIIDSYRSSECILEDDERKIVIHRGNPYITLHICLQAITTRTKIFLMHEEFMLGVNEILFKIIDNVLKAYKIYNLINKYEKFSKNRLEKIKEFYDEIVIIGDTAIYQILEKEENVKYYPFNNIFLYCDSIELEKLQEAIYIYANENEYELEIVYEDDIEDAIELINLDDTKNMAILLTKSDKNKEKFINEIKNKEVFVNENPFKSEVGKIYNYLR